MHICVWVCAVWCVALCVCVCVCELACVCVCVCVCVCCVCARVCVHESLCKPADRAAWGKTVRKTYLHIQTHTSIPTYTHTLTHPHLHTNPSTHTHTQNPLTWCQHQQWNCQVCPRSEPRPWWLDPFEFDVRLPETLPACLETKCSPTQKHVPLQQDFICINHTSTTNKRIIILYQI